MKRNLFWSASFAALVMSAPAYAQQATGTSEAAQATASDAQDGDIVVTALRQSSLLSKTPVAVTAVTGDSLRSLGITDPRTLSNIVPNVTMSEYNNGIIIQIRGISSSDTTEKGDPSAAFLMDGIYIARPQDQVGAFYDVERVEALRGPQGTLYGRNTTAGAINIITTLPKHELEGSVDAQLGNLHTANVTGIINLPVGETLGVRAAVNYQRQDNFLLPGTETSNSLNPGRSVASGRLSFGGEVSSRFKFVIRGDYSRNSGSTFSTLPLSNFFPGTLVTGVDPQYVDIGSRAQRTLPDGLQFPSRSTSERWGIMGEFTYDLDWAQITYLGAYRDSKANGNGDLVFSFGQTPSLTNSHFKQQSHELRAAFGQNQPFHGQVGLYYFRETGSISLLLGPPLATAFGGPGATGFDIEQGAVASSSKAAFGQVTYDLTPELHLTGGMRYTEDRKSRFGTTDLLYGPVVVPISANSANGKFHKLTWKAGVDYDVPGLGLLYAGVSTGYKAGGFNDGCVAGTGPGCAGDPATFYYNPETLTAYEGGAKLKFGRGIRLNAGVYHYDYSNLQLSQVTLQGGTPVSLTRNAGKAKVDGVELEAILNPSPNDRFDLSANYTNARYTDFVPNATYPNTTNPLRFDGRQLDRAPKWSGIAGYTHTFPIGDTDNVELVGRVRLSSAYFLQDLNNLSQFRQPGYTKSDITLTYNGDNRTWYLQAYVNNLENKITLAYASSGLQSLAGIEQPRTFGIRAGRKF